MASYEPAEQEDAISGWAVGGTFFAATMLIMLGFFQAITGFAAILEDEFFVLTRNYVFDLDVSAWGWIHLVIGVVAVFAGAYIMTGATWARAIGILAALVIAVNNFLFLPYYDLWSLVGIAISVWVIWSLTKPVGRMD
ncbi:MAG TPA: hypothetical protein VFZ12_06770 [Dehalococcoidia bacterium]|nr:hypothetical protein [Dehalococcoidia bacterium]